eukprot:gene11450-477_t
MPPIITSTTAPQSNMPQDPAPAGEQPLRHPLDQEVTIHIKTIAAMNEYNFQPSTPITEVKQTVEQKVSKKVEKSKKEKPKKKAKANLLSILDDDDDDDAPVDYQPEALAIEKKAPQIFVPDDISQDLMQAGETIEGKKRIAKAPPAPQPEEPTLVVSESTDILGDLLGGTSATPSPIMAVSPDIPASISATQGGVVIVTSLGACEGQIADMTVDLYHNSCLGASGISTKDRYFRTFVMKPLIALGTRQLDWTDSHAATGDKLVGDGDRPRDESGQHSASGKCPDGIVPVLKVEPGALALPFYKKGSWRKCFENLRFPDHLRILHTCAETLAVLHESDPHPIVHLDIKPDNVLIDDHDVARIADFGLARSALELIEKSHRSTKHGFGTPGFEAPELMRKNPSYSFKSDVYSFGMMMLVVAT